jgi:hypothetical protein
MIYPDDIIERADEHATKPSKKLFKNLASINNSHYHTFLLKFILSYLTMIKAVNSMLPIHAWIMMHPTCFDYS